MLLSLPCLSPAASFASFSGEYNGFMTLPLTRAALLLTLNSVLNYAKLVIQGRYPHQLKPMISFLVRGNRKSISSASSAAQWDGKDLVNDRNQGTIKDAEVASGNRDYSKGSDIYGLC